MNFGQALELLKQGKPVCRIGWNGKNLYVELVEGKDHADSKIESFFVIYNGRGTYNTWVPSVSDVLANDWLEVTVL